MGHSRIAGTLWVTEINLLLNLLFSIIKPLMKQFWKIRQIISCYLYKIMFVCVFSDILCNCKTPTVATFDCSCLLDHRPTFSFNLFMFISLRVIICMKRLFFCIIYIFYTMYYTIFQSISHSLLKNNNAI